MSDTESSGPAIAGRTMASWASFIVLIGSILVIGLLFFRIISAFFVPLFLAALLVVIFRPVHRWVLGRCKQRARLAAGISTAAIFLIVLLPTGLIFTYGILQGIELLSSLHVDDLPDRVVKTRRILGLEMPQPEAIHRTDGLFQEAIDTIKDGRSANPTAADDLIWMVDGITTGLDEKTTRHAHNKLIDTKTALEAAISHRAERFEFDKQMQSAFNHYQEFLLRDGQSNKGQTPRTPGSWRHVGAKSCLADWWSNRLSAGETGYWHMHHRHFALLFPGRRPGNDRDGHASIPARGHARKRAII